jgi:hypothetical protein
LPLVRGVRRGGPRVHERYRVAALGPRKHLGVLPCDSRRNPGNGRGDRRVGFGPTGASGLPAKQDRRGAMKQSFKVGDRVIWNSEAGRVSGKIVKVHTKDLDYKGYTHHASKDDPQYEIKSDKTDHVALHKGAALRRSRRQA